MIVNGEEFINEKELSRLCGLSLTIIRNARYKRNLPHYKFHHSIFFKEKEVMSWLEKNIHKI